MSSVSLRVVLCLVFGAARVAAFGHSTLSDGSNEGPFAKFGFDPECAWEGLTGRCAQCCSQCDFVDIVNITAGTDYSTASKCICVEGKTQEQDREFNVTLTPFDDCLFAHAMVGGSFDLGDGDNVAILESFYNTGTRDRDFLRSGSGDDDITLLYGNNVNITTGPGNDKIVLISTLEPYVTSGAGDDEIWLTNVDEPKVYAGAGDDTFQVIDHGLGGYLHGGEGNDYFNVNTRGDFNIYGEAGNDTINLLNSGDGRAGYTDGGDGDDHISTWCMIECVAEGGDGNDVITMVGPYGTARGDGGDDIISVNSHYGKAYGGDGIDACNVGGSKYDDEEAINECEE